MENEIFSEDCSGYFLVVTIISLLVLMIAFVSNVNICLLLWLLQILVSCFVKTSRFEEYLCVKVRLIC